MMGRALYPIVYANGWRGRERTLSEVCAELPRIRKDARRFGASAPVRVEPVEGSEFRATWADMPDSPSRWIDAGYLVLGWVDHAYVPLSKLELRSPVRS